MPENSSELSRWEIVWLCVWFLIGLLGFVVVVMSSPWSDYMECVASSSPSFIPDHCSFLDVVTSSFVSLVALVIWFVLFYFISSRLGRIVKRFRSPPGDS